MPHLGGRGIENGTLGGTWDDQHRNPNMKTEYHLVGQLTRVTLVGSEGLEIKLRGTWVSSLIGLFENMQQVHCMVGNIKSSCTQVGSKKTGVTFYLVLSFNCHNTFL